MFVFGNFSVYAHDTVAAQARLYFFFFFVCWSFLFPFPFLFLRPAICFLLLFAGLSRPVPSFAWGCSSWICDEDVHVSVELLPSMLGTFASVCLFLPACLTLISCSQYWELCFVYFLLARSLSLRSRCLFSILRISSTESKWFDFRSTTFLPESLFFSTRWPVNTL